MDRRNFLKKFIKSFFLILGSGSLILISYLYPRNIKEKRVLYIYLTDEDLLPKSGIKKFEYTLEREGKRVTNLVFLKKDEKGLTALSPFCTHLGCLIKWSNAQNEFVCSCHGGKFDKEGNVIAGPPPKPLEKMPLEIRDGKVFLGIKVDG